MVELRELEEGDEIRVTVENNWWIEGTVFDIFKEEVPVEEYSIEIVPEDYSTGWSPPEETHPDLVTVWLSTAYDSANPDPSVRMEWQQAPQYNDTGSLNIIEGYSGWAEKVESLE